MYILHLQCFSSKCSGRRFDSCLSFQPTFHLSGGAGSAEKSIIFVVAGSALARSATAPPNLNLLASFSFSVCRLVYEYLGQTFRYANAQQKFLPVLVHKSSEVRKHSVGIFKGRDRWTEISSLVL
jgi:hypothetical protein